METITINYEEYKCLDSLRKEKIRNAVEDLMRALLFYYPAGTKIEVTKDAWRIIGDDATERKAKQTSGLLPDLAAELYKRRPEVCRDMSKEDYIAFFCE